MFGWYRQGEGIGSNKPVAPRPSKGGKAPISGKVKKGEVQPGKRAVGNEKAEEHKTSIDSREVQTGKKRLKELTKDFEKLGGLLEKKYMDLDWLNNNLQYRLDVVDKRLMTKEDKIKISTTIKDLFLAQKDMRSALFNNLRANHKAMRMIVERTETLKLTDQERGSLNSGLDKLGEVQAKLINVMEKDVKDLKMGDLVELQKLIKTLSEAMNSSKTSGLLARIAEEGSDLDRTFTKQLEASKEMVEIFEKAVDALKPLTEDESLWKTLEEKLVGLRTADGADAKNSALISLLGVLVGIAVFVGALLLAFLVLTTPAGMFVTILGGVLFGGSLVGGSLIAGLSGFGAYGYMVAPDKREKNFEILKNSISFLTKLNEGGETAQGMATEGK